MKRAILLPVFFLLIFAGCTKEDQNNTCAMECAPAAPTIKLNIVEENSHRSIIIVDKEKKGSIAIRLYSKQRLKKDIPFTIEERTNYISFDIVGSDEIEVWIDGKLEDTLKVETKYVKTDCCGSLEIVKLSVNNTFISKPEGYVIEIKK